MKKVISIKLNEDDDFIFEVITREDTKREQISKAKEMFYKNIKVAKKNNEEIDYSEFLYDAFSDCGIAFDMVVRSTWIVD